MKRWIRDWWRGWSDEDLTSVLRKVEIHEDCRPGEIIPVSMCELRAHVAYSREQHPMLYIKA